MKEALKLNWSDDDLKKRDHSKGAALYLEDDDEELLLQAEEDGSEPPCWMTEEQQEEYNHLTSEVESAMAAYQGARRTLKDARERQTMMRKNRSFYPMKRESMKPKPKAEPGKQCFRCGGSHTTASCPRREEGPRKDSKEVHFTFALSSPEPTATDNEIEAVNQMAANLQTMSGILDSGMAIIDGGATSTVGSVDALERIQELNQQQGQDHRCILDFEEKPSFRFGNNGRKTCMSTAQLPVPLHGVMGHMRVHIHDVPGQPVLLSIAALRSLGAVIDFENDEMILKKICPDRVVPLERTFGGHQVFPLTQDIFKDSVKRQQPFSTLRDDHVE